MFWRAAYGKQFGSAWREQVIAQLNCMDMGWSRHGGNFVTSRGEYLAPRAHEFPIPSASAASASAVLLNRDEGGRPMQLV